MKAPSNSMSAGTRAQGTPSTMGPGPKERASVRQGMSSGVIPGNRMAGNQGPGIRRDNVAAIYADEAARLVGGSATIGKTRHRGA